LLKFYLPLSGVEIGCLLTNPRTNIFAHLPEKAWQSQKAACIPTLPSPVSLFRKGDFP